MAHDQFGVAALDAQTPFLRRALDQEVEVGLGLHAQKLNEVSLTVAPGAVEAVHDSTGRDLVGLQDQLIEAEDLIRARSAPGVRPWLQVVLLIRLGRFSKELGLAGDVLLAILPGRAQSTGQAAAREGRGFHEGGDQVQHVHLGTSFNSAGGPQLSKVSWTLALRAVGMVQNPVSNVVRDPSFLHEDVCQAKLLVCWPSRHYTSFRKKERINSESKTAVEGCGCAFLVSVASVSCVGRVFGVQVVVQMWCRL